MKLFIALILILSSFVSRADICPHPLDIQLHNGEIPKPWVKNPASQNEPNFGYETVFVGANILTPPMSHGVFCYYRNHKRTFSIWQPANVVIPLGAYWRVLLGGYECLHSLEACVFRVEKSISPNPM